MIVSLKQSPMGTWVAAVEQKGRVVKLFHRPTAEAAAAAARDWLALPKAT